MNRLSDPRETFAAAVLMVLALVLFLPLWAAGLSPYWGDLTYLHHPWQASVAGVLQQGRLPLWDPDLYFGMPMAANMQRAVFSPGTVAFRLFDFATALAIFHAAHYWLAGWLAFLWLRSWRAGPGSALAGGALFMLGGELISRMPFLNHLAVLSLLPALLLFFDRPFWLGLTLAGSFLAGYPPFLIGGAAAAWALAVVMVRPGSVTAWARASLGTWLAAGLLAAGLAACQLLPGLELAALSRRGAGMGVEETLRYGFAPRDLLLWISPALSWRDYDPAINWARCVHVGFIGAGAAAVGLWVLRVRRAAGLTALLAAVGVLLLGAALPLSRTLWEVLPPLRFIRYPGNLAFLGWPLAALLAAAGFSRLSRGWRAAAFLLLAVELLLYAHAALPAAARGLFTWPGPVVRALQDRGDARRYLLSPRALESHDGADVFDWKGRLYGLTNDPYRLRAAGNFGEPLVPSSSYAVMDFLYSRPSAESAARFLPALGTSILLAPRDAQAPPSLTEVFPGRRLPWRGFKTARPAALAWWLDEAAGAALSAGLPARTLPESARAVALEWSRRDRFAVHGPPRGPAGWVFIAEPRFPGWRATLSTGGRFRAAAAEPAWEAFQKVRVPSGPWRLEFRYEPLSWRLGWALSLLSLLGVGAYWYNSVLRALHED